MRTHLFAAISLGFLAAACQPAEQPRYSSAPPPPAYTAAYTGSEQVCTEYGFTPGTTGFDRCVSNERAARATGRVNQTYAEARLNTDARNACMSYGLQPSSGWYNQCVSREVDARRYQAASQPSPQTYPPYRTDQYGNRIDAQGYRVDANGYRYQEASQPSPQTYPAYRTDQYGNRIDAQGYRVDANGNRLPRQG